MKSLMRLLSKVLHDCSICCDTSTTRDLIRITRRVEHEGISFLTITLGDFAQDFERGLELGQIGSTFFRSFAKNGSIPILFSGMTNQVFDESGRLLDEPSIAAISAIRQICRMWKKLTLPCTKAREHAAVEGYLKVEQELSMIDLDPSTNQYLSDFYKVSDLLWSVVLGTANNIVMSGNHVPYHGPGVTATKVLPNQKYDWTVWHQRLEPYFPSDSFCYHNSTAFLEESSRIAFANPEQEQPVRVVFVPKTLKTPRVIAVEPACMQYTQQSLSRLIMASLESHSMTIGHINFRDQTINAKLALDASKRGHLATIDLSEASDRVHHALVYRMLSTVPYFRDALFACRSTRATLPTGQTIQLEKFASMGSAMCFPIESMVFYTLLLSREIRRLGLPLTSRSIAIVQQNVFVYGDDLIIPVDGVSSAFLGLSNLGLKVNTHKSFFRGNFRESCGVDAYAGIDVTTIYLRRLLPKGRRDVQGIVSLVAMSNQLFDKGWFNTASFIENFLAKLGLKIPYVSDTPSCVGYRRYVTPTVHRRNENLQRPEVWGYVVVPKFQHDRIDGHAGLMKWFLQGLNPDVRHSERSVGTGSLAIKSRWCAV
jgi:hypothetical protein